MAFSVFILLITSFGMWHVAMGKISTVLDVVGIAFDIVDFGMSIHELVTSSLRKQIENLRTELLTKLDEIHLSIDQLRELVTQNFQQQQLQDRMKTVQQFELSTKVRIEELEDVVSSNQTISEQTSRWNIFLDGIEEYVRVLRTIIPSSVSLLKLVNTQTNCDMTDMQVFSDYIRNLILSGISIESTYKRYKYNLTEKTYWEEKLSQYDSNVTSLYNECLSKFKELFAKDISQKYSSLESLLAALDKRYTDKVFFVVQIEQHDISVSNATMGQCVYQDQACTIRRCFIYQLKEAKCEEMVSVRISREGQSFYDHKISKDYPAVYVTDLVTDQIDYLIPKICTVWAQKWKPFVKPANITYLEGLGTTCGSILCQSKSHFILMMLLFTACIT